MDQNWQAYTDVATASRPGRFSHATGQQPANGSAQHQPQSGYSYEAYQTPSIPSQPQSMAVSPVGTPRTRTYSGDGDVAMEDADPYNRMKYPSRPTHSQRPSAQYLGHEDSSAARRYSPMKTLSPSSPYAPSSQQSSQSPYGHYASQSTSARQSPTRSNHYSTPSQSYYSTPSKSSNMPIPTQEKLAIVLIVLQHPQGNHPYSFLPSNLALIPLTNSTQILQQRN